MKKTVIVNKKEEYGFKSIRIECREDNSSHIKHLEIYAFKIDNWSIAASKTVTVRAIYLPLKKILMKLM